MLLVSLIILINLLIQTRTSSYTACARNERCYGSPKLCRPLQSFIKPNTVSRMTCFRNEAILNFTMGTNKPVFKADGESPARQVSLEPFCLDQTEVSNLQFYQFVQETNYKTEAENLGDSFCLLSLLNSAATRKTIKKAAAQVPWWVLVRNATWLTPGGLQSSIYSRLTHPVVHVSWNDAHAYCRFFSKRLPTEAEWEMACRGGLHDRLYPWGNSKKPRGQHFMNIWHGDFPVENTVEDGFRATAPVHRFTQNQFAMKNIVGNVWEWTADWWRLHATREEDETRSFTDKVKKGGSFMCTPSFCHRYRCAARGKNTPDTSAVNLGFRCAKSL